MQFPGNSQVARDQNLPDTKSESIQLLNLHYDNDINEAKFYRAATVAEGADQNYVI